ncbi:MAG: ABC-three component system protein [Bacteroidota bacterium]
MSDRNATASWSGYSHQGQVGLLIALRKLQEAGLDLNNHYVQFETHEDVAIYSEQPGGAKTYLTVHQVKAYYSATNIYKSTYNSVLNNAFEDGDEKYLHTASEITDWDTSTTANNNNVLRYEYSAAKYHCGTTEIETFIKAELTTILSPVAQAIIDNAYLRLSFELDHRIRQEHQKAHKHLFDIKFSLHEINQLIRSDEIFTKKEIYDCRKLFYDTYIEIIRTENLTPERINSIHTSIIGQINALDDGKFRLLLQSMNLHRTPNQLKQSQVYYSQDGLKQVFFRMIIDIIDTNPTLIENVIKYDKNTEPNKFVLTAITDEERDKLTVIENILTNLQSQNLLWESHSLVNKEIEIELVQRNPAINAVATAEEKEDDKNKFMSFTNSKLVKREDALAKLNNGAHH